MNNHNPEFSVDAPMFNKIKQTRRTERECAQSSVNNEMERISFNHNCLSYISFNLRTDRISLALR